MKSTNMDAVAEKLLEQVAERLVEKGATTEDLGGSRAEMVATVAKMIRWEPRPDRNPPSILIMRRGSKKKGVSNVVASISATGDFSDLYPSWEPVLADWQRKREQNNGSRVTHDDLGFGGVPVAESED